MVELCETCGRPKRDTPRPGAVIRERRQAVGMTQEALLAAAESDRPGSWLSHLECHRLSIPDWAEWQALCRALQLDPAAAAAGRERLTV